MNSGKPRVAVVGATGAVGRTLLEIVAEREFPIGELHLLASARSGGRSVPALGGQHPVGVLDNFDFSQVDVAFFSAGTAISEVWAPKATAAGAIVIDNTNAWRMDPDTPLVVPQVNGYLLAKRPISGIVANPNCSTIPLVRLLQPVRDRWGLRDVVVSTYQAASGRGLSGLDELAADSRRVLDRPDEAAIEERFPLGLAFNVLPSIDRPLPNGFTLEEQKMLQESRKIMNVPDLELTSTCVRVPVQNSHSEAVFLRCNQEVDRDELVELLAAQAEVVVHDRDRIGEFPTPRTASGQADVVHVGRVRVVEHDPRSVWLWLVADNLRIGAALNAVQIAEGLHAKQVL